MTDNHHPEAPFARQEIFETNRVHIPLAMTLGLLPFVVIVLHHFTGAVLFLAMAAWMAVPAMVPMIRAEALVKRHWTLWIELMNLIGVTPKNPSGFFVLAANILGILFMVTMVLTAHALMPPQVTFLEWLLMITGDSAFVVAIGLFIWAGLHKVEFE